MEATLAALGGILLRAIPTLLIVVLLHFYLKFMFFKPLHKVLQSRYDATEGARRIAAESLERASAKVAEYEAAMREARAQVYQAQEQVHRRLEEQRTAEVQKARERAEASVREARAQLQMDMETAKATLSAESERIAERIADTVLRRRTA